MKRGIGEYGAIIFIVLIGSVFLAFMNEVVLQQLKMHFMIGRSIAQKALDDQAPLLEGLDNHGRYLALKIFDTKQYHTWLTQT